MSAATPNPLYQMSSEEYSRYEWEVIGGSGQVVYTCMTEVAAAAYAALHWSWTYRKLAR